MDGRTKHSPQICRRGGASSCSVHGSLRRVGCILLLKLRRFLFSNGVGTHVPRARLLRSVLASYRQRHVLGARPVSKTWQMCVSSLHQWLRIHRLLSVTLPRGRLVMVNTAVTEYGGSSTKSWIPEGMGSGPCTVVSRLKNHAAHARQFTRLCTEGGRFRVR